MKFIISENTVNTLNAQVHLTLVQEGAPAAIINALVLPAQEITHLQNVSITRETEFIPSGLMKCNVEHNWVVEVNDEILFKYLRVYIMVGKFVAGIMASLKGLMSSLEVEFNSINTFITQRK